VLGFYLFCLLLGGVLVALSALGGASDAEVDADVELELDMDADAELELEADADVDADADMDGDADADGHATADVASAWLPIASMRFWTFFLAFGGLTGAALTVLEAGGGPISIALIAAAVGYATGIAITRIVRSLRGKRVDSTLRRDDYVGSSAAVLLPVGPAQTGQVRIQIGGRIVDLAAETEDDEELARESEVFVYAVRDDGTLLVTAHATLD
jgi:membrane protein implicated in regulation of membrane protease activity